VVECQLPKLDVAGSNPVSRSIFSITYTELTSYSNPLFEVTRYLIQRNLLMGRNFNN
jgi:hypothetical protein